MCDCCLRLASSAMTCRLPAARLKILPNFFTTSHHESLSSPTRERIGARCLGIDPLLPVLRKKRGQDPIWWFGRLSVFLLPEALTPVCISLLSDSPNLLIRKDCFSSGFFETERSLFPSTVGSPALPISRLV